MPEERRLATVLFADIVGSSGLTGSHDPEVVRHRLAATFAAMRKVLVDHGGTVEKFIGDAVMAVFGVPEAHDDDAARAVGAGLALRDVVRLLERDELRLRIGINTGEVVAGDEAHAETLVTGMPVIVASRLQSAAAPDEILVGSLTRRLTDDRFGYGPARTITFKGVSAIPASPVLSTDRDRNAPAPSGLFVGRATELSGLRAALENVAHSGASRRITVIGPPGIGKTRIAQELARAAELLWGRCATYGEGGALAALRQIVRDRTAVAPTDPLVTAFLSGRPLSTEMSANDAQLELAAALARLIDATHRGRVTVLVIEDLHAAEPALLDLLEEIRVRARTPLLILGLARPEILERAWAWVAGGETILLAPLGSVETEELARSLLGKQVSPDVLLSITTRAGGIPLYVEHVARSVMEGDDPEDIPPTLRGLIAARIDRAGPGVRRLLQRGSVLGRDFWLGAVPADGVPALAESAGDAQARGLIAAIDAPGPSGQPTLRFTHALIRDVAYASTTKVERMSLHTHYAEWLAAIGTERAADSADAIAYHSEQAFRYASELEHPSASDLGRAAFDALMAATMAARGRADFRAALALSARALSVGERAAIQPERMADALGHHAMIRLRLEPGPEALRLLDRAIDAAREVRLGEQLVRLLGWRAGIVLIDDVARARALLAEAVDVARATGDVELITYSLSRSGLVGEATGHLDEQANVLVEARDLALRAHALGWLPDTLAELSANALSQGDVSAARAHALEAARAASKGSPLQRFKASLAISAALLADGVPDEALEEARAASALGREIGGPWALAVSAEILARVHETRGDITEARNVLAEAVAKLDPAATPAMRPFVARIRAALGQIEVHQGALDAARSAADAALAIAPSTDVRATAHARWALAEVDAAAGMDADARSNFTAALDAIEPTGYCTLAARIRSSYAAYLAKQDLVPNR